MTDLDPDIDWVSLLEAQGAGPEKYHAHSNAHAMACQKYTVAAQQAKLSGNSERAKLLRKIGKKHKLVADTLAAIASDHVGATYSIQMKKKAQLMPKKKQPVQEETIIEEIVDVTPELEEELEADELEQIEEDEGMDPIHAMIGFALTEQPLDFQDAVHFVLAEIVADRLEGLKIRLQEAINSDDDAEDEEDDDADAVPQGIRISKPSAPDGQVPKSMGEEVEELEEEQIDEEGKKGEWLRGRGRKISKTRTMWNGGSAKPKGEYTPKSKDRSGRAHFNLNKMKKFKGMDEGYRYATTEPGPEGHGTRPPMGQEHLAEPTGKKFPTGRQDGDANTLPKIGTKKKSQKGTTVAAGDTVRTQRAAD